MAHGNSQVILCERGIRTFETSTRNTLDISAIPVLKRETHLPVIVDPSHAAGRADLVPALAAAAVAVGADGLIVEVHPDPASALSDGAQSLTFDAFAEMMRMLAPLAATVWALGSIFRVTSRSRSMSLRGERRSVGAEGVRMTADCESRRRRAWRIRASPARTGRWRSRRNGAAQATAVGTPTFSEALALLGRGRADFAVIPVWNSTIGEIQDTSVLLAHHASRLSRRCPSSTVPVVHCLLGLARVRRSTTVRYVGSHPTALAQCRRLFANRQTLQPCIAHDTAGAARELATLGGRISLESVAPARRRRGSSPIIRRIRAHSR